MDTNTTQQTAAQSTDASTKTQTVTVDGVRYTFTREPHIDGTTDGDVIARTCGLDASGNEVEITWYADNPDAELPEDVVTDWSKADRVREI